MGTVLFVCDMLSGKKDYGKHSNGSLRHLLMRIFTKTTFIKKKYIINHKYINKSIRQNNNKFLENIKRFSIAEILQAK